MPHHNTVFSHILKLLPRHEFSVLANKHDGQRRCDAMNRWTQFVAMATAQLTGRASLPDIESALASQKHLTYSAARNPMAPSPIANFGGVSPRDFSFNSTSHQLCVDSRTPSSIARKCFSPRSFTPITTRAHSFVCSALCPL